MALRSTKRSFVTADASSSTTPGAPSGWRVLRLRYYVGSPPERESCLLVLNSVTSTPQWILQPKAAWGVCVVFVFACKYVLRHSRVSQPPNSGYASSSTLAFSLHSMPPRPATDDTLTHTGSSTALRPAPSHPMGPSLSLQVGTLLCLQTYRPSTWSQMGMPGPTSTR
jgi:hypothetical protein